jgi:hypothetical protein
MTWNFKEMMEWVEARASRSDDGCLIWKFSMNGRQPQGGIKQDGIKRSVNVRRELWTLKTGKPPPRNWVVLCKCGNDRCVEPTCLKVSSRSKMLSGIPISAAHKVALTLAARSRKSAKLTQEAANDIRYGDGTPEEKAAKYGVTVNHVRGIQQNRWWRDLTSPFAGLGA